jgi:hypothetical protein
MREVVRDLGVGIVHADFQTQCRATRYGDEEAVWITSPDHGGAFHLSLRVLREAIEFIEEVDAKDG